ncbi:MAG: hypothetical protein R3E66_19775 [bacterium]
MSDESQATVSAEFPVVVLKDDNATDAVTPPKRMLQGRIAERWVLYPIYTLVFASAGLVFQFTVTNDEWATTPALTAWASLFVWYWFYGVAYRYRRRFFKYVSVSVLVVLTWCLSLICFDRAKPQIVALAGKLVVRPDVPQLYWAGVLTIIAVALLGLHVLVLGRGYRQKKS